MASALPMLAPSSMRPRETMEKPGKNMGKLFLFEKNLFEQIFFRKKIWKKHETKYLGKYGKTMGKS
jgi:hypothetical protein